MEPWRAYRGVEVGDVVFVDDGEAAVGVVRAIDGRDTVEATMTIEIAGTTFAVPYGLARARRGSAVYVARAWLAPEMAALLPATTASAGADFEIALGVLEAALVRRGEVGRRGVGRIETAVEALDRIAVLDDRTAAGWAQFLADQLVNVRSPAPIDPRAFFARARASLHRALGH